MAEVRDDRQRVFVPRTAAGRRSPAVLVMLLIAVLAAIALIWNVSRRSTSRRAMAPVTSGESVESSAAAAEPAGTAAPSESAPAAAAAPAIDESDSEAASATAYNQAAIARVINDGRAGVTNCYQRALVRDETLVQGELNVRVSVAASGRVGSVSISGPAAFRAMEPCLRRAINKWTFPTAAEAYTTEFPLRFRGVQ
ncbi:MAG TPA: AgmX/PglI C-terminal domain-containing protein [Polyangia bacterium]